MPAKKGQSKSASAAKLPATNVEGAYLPSGTQLPFTPQNEERAPFGYQVNRNTSRATQQNAGSMIPISPAHNSPQRAGLSSYGTAQLAQQGRQPLQIFEGYCPDQQDNLNPTVSAMFNGASSSAETPFGPLGQRRDQTQNMQHTYNHAENIQHHQSFQWLQDQHIESPHRPQNFPAQNIQNYHIHNYQANLPRGNSEHSYQSAEFDPRSQQYDISLEHKDATHDAKYLDAKYSNNHVSTASFYLPVGNLIRPGTDSHPSSSHASTGHAVFPPIEALGSASQATTTLAGTTHSGSSIATGAPKQAEPAAYGELSQDFLDQVSILVRHTGRTQYGGYIQNAFHAVEYEQAVLAAKTRGKKGFDQKCDDYPVDDAGQQAVVQRLFEAIVNLDGEQDPVSDDGEFLTSLAVKTVRSISPVEVELVAYRLMEAIRKVQAGIPVAPASVKITQEGSFAAKVDAVVAALSINKGLCKSAIGRAEDVARVAADPAWERAQKIRNRNGNIKKGGILCEASQKAGTTRKGKGRGKGKRPANTEVEAESEPGSSAEAVIYREAGQVSQAEA